MGDASTAWHTPTQQVAAWLRKAATIEFAGAAPASVPAFLDWADAIEAQGREIGRLTIALKQIAAVQYGLDMSDPIQDREAYWSEMAIAYRMTARNALKMHTNPSDAQPSTDRDAAGTTTHLPGGAPPLGSPAPNPTTFYSEAHVFRLHAALKAARGLIIELRNSDFSSFTVGTDPETMDESERAVIAEYDAVLAQIDEVMK